MEPIDQARAQVAELGTRVMAASDALTAVSAQATELVAVARWHLQMLLQMQNAARATLAQLEHEKKKAEPPKAEPAKPQEATA